MFSSAFKYISRRYTSYQRIHSVITKKPGESVEVQGWIQNIRKMKKNLFLDVSDGSTSQKFQVVLAKSSANDLVTVGSSIKVSGKLAVAPNGNPELHAENIHVVGDGHITEGYPFTPKQVHPAEYAREFLHLRTRVDYMAAVFRIRHRAIKTIHDFMDENDFVNVHTPILTANDCEGAGEIFTLKPDSKDLLKEMSRPAVPFDESYFDKKVFLTVSGQLHLEAMSYGLGNTYTLSPAFRAENCKSPLHLCEFYMFEAELAFITELEQLTNFIEKMLKETTAKILEKSKSDVDLCQKKNSSEVDSFDWLNVSWKRLSYEEAYDVLLKNKDKLKTKLEENQGFSKDQELYLVDYFKCPIFLINWPKNIKPFYMKECPNDPLKVQALDLLMPSVGELVGGSLREFDVNRLKDNIPDGLQWYLDIRKFGGVPTGGFGIGLDRYLQLITGVKNIRDVIPYPRYPHNCKM